MEMRLKPLAGVAGPRDDVVCEFQKPMSEGDAAVRTTRVRQRVCGLVKSGRLVRQSLVSGTV